MELKIVFPISIRLMNKGDDDQYFTPYKETFPQVLKAHSIMELQMSTVEEALYYLRLRKQGFNTSLVTGSELMNTFLTTPFNNDAAILNEDGTLTLLKAEENKVYSDGIGTYFGASDKNTPIQDKASCTIDLDLGAFNKDDITCWCLSFNQKLENGTYGYVDEVKFGIAKTDTGFKVADLTGDVGIYWSEKDLEHILTLGKDFTNATPKATISFTYSKLSIDYEIKVDTVTITGTKKMNAPVVGLRNMWHVCTNNNKTVLTDITIETK